MIRLILVFLLILPAYARAGLFNSSKTKQNESGKHLNISNKKILNQTKEKGNKRTHTNTNRQSRSKERKHTNEQTKSFGLSFTANVPFSLIFIPVASQLEKKDFFGSCRIFTRRITMNDLLGSEQDGVVNLLKQEYYNNLAARGGKTKCVKCIRYANCMTRYAVVLDTAQTLLISDLANLKARGIIKVNSQTRKGIRKISIRGINFDMLKTMFMAEAIKAAIKARRQKSGYYYDLMQGLSADENSVVRLTQNGFVINTKQGDNITVSLPITFYLNNLNLLSPDALGAIKTVFSLTSSQRMSFSYLMSTGNSRVIEKTKAIERYASQIAQQGLAKEYVISLQKALKLLADGKTDFDAEKIMKP